MSETVKKLYVSTRALDRLSAQWETVRGEVVMECDYTRLEQECDRLKELCGGYVIGLDDERRKTISQSNMVGLARKERDAALAECERLRAALEFIAKLHIIPPYMTPQASQLILVKGHADAALGAKP